MFFLTVAVVFVGLLGALNLILMIGVIKRLREHTERLSAFSPQTSDIEVGTEITAFRAVTVDDEPLTLESLGDDTLVAFFSPSCGPCKTTLPSFVAHARSLPGGRNRVLATVVGDTDAAEQFVAELKPVARVVVEPPAGTVSTAFGARAYPTLLRVGRGDGGRLVVTASRVDLATDGDPAAEAGSTTAHVVA
ncbi:TlpA family protein disulfide reductase [Streptomyces echinatus]|uniref:TlpA family protein disulfide reductase n=1 Tax=Streptomyces echinatus TaxID=67293 RepID=UPI0037BB59D9